MSLTGKVLPVASKTARRMSKGYGVFHKWSWVEAPGFSPVKRSRSERGFSPEIPADTNKTPFETRCQEIVTVTVA
jgi:hypothetical protein